MPLVSVVVPCYNHLPYLREALDSARRQTHPNVEIIAIDDGSTDGTREALADEPDIHLILNEVNLGTYATLNRAIEAAAGEWIAILNDDDVWEPNKLERQLAAASEATTLVGTFGVFIDGQGHPVEGTPQGFRFEQLPSPFDVGQLIYRNRLIASSVIFRRETWSKVGGFDPSYYGFGDWQMWIRLAMEGPGAFCPDPLTRYRFHSTQASNASEKMERESMRVREWIAAQTDRLHPHDYCQEHAFNWRCIGASRESFGDRSGALAAYRKSLQLCPSFVTYARKLRLQLRGVR